MRKRAPGLGGRIMAVGALLVVVALGLAAWSLLSGGDGPARTSALPEPDGPKRTASFDSGGDLSQFDQINRLGGSIQINDAPDGTRSGNARYDGGDGNGYARGIFNVRWGAGETVRYSARFYVPEELLDNAQGQVGLMRWDDYEDHPLDQAHGGLVIFGDDKRARLVRELLNKDSETVDEAELGAPFPVPTDRWFKVEIRQRLGTAADGARSEVYLDDVKVTESDDTNLTPGRVVSRVRYGIVAIDAGEQSSPLELWFDDALAQPAVRGQS